MSNELTETKICVTQGDSLPIILDFHQDITGAVVRMQVRDKEGNLMIGKTLQDHTDAALGQTVLTLTPEETSIPVGCYETDMEITFIDGTRYTFYPPTVDKRACFCVMKQITREDA